MTDTDMIHQREPRIPFQARRPTTTRLPLDLVPSPKKVLVKGILISLTAIQLTILGTAPQADALSAELAKKCRDMAIKSHPPPTPPGNKAYAQAEREFFRACISRNGQMPDDGPHDQSDPAQH
jgi:hypothetical protein